MEDPDFKTALNLYKKPKNHKGRPKGSSKNNTTLLNYRSWIIEVDNSFPSINYIVRKKTDAGYHYVAYCSSLENALKLIYDQMLLDTVNRRNNYGSRFNDLRNVILETKKQFSQLLDITPILKNKIKKEKKRNDTG